MSRHLLFIWLMWGCGGLDQKTPDGDKEDDTSSADPSDSAFHPLDSADHDGTNHRPVADAGADREAAVAAVVALDGSGSSDIDGDALLYFWSFTSLPHASSAMMLNGSRVDAQFVPDVEGEYVVQLVVDDGQQESLPDTAVITAVERNEPPVADAGPDQTVSVGSYVNLDGNDSRDPEGERLSYQWSLLTAPAGSTAVLVGGTSVSPSFEADIEGRYSLQLVVNDGVQDSAPDGVTISAETGSSSSGCGCARAMEIHVKRGAAWVFVLMPFLWGVRRRGKCDDVL